MHPNSKMLRLLTFGLILAPTLASANQCLSRYYESSGPDHPERMTSLPGWNQPLPSPWFSGYLDYELDGRQVHTHYILVLAETIEESEQDHDEKPLIYWSNGGPGASSMFGLLTEIGPLVLSEESLKSEDFKSSGIPTPIYNPYAWSRLGHLLTFDQPAPVGFSYCNDDTVTHSCGGMAWTDELTSQNAYLAMQAFFQRFDCLASTPLYLTGESYAGIYIPTLARRIINDQENNKINLRGFAVGDGCLGTETSVCGDLSPKGGGAGLFQEFWSIVFMGGHHQIPLKDFHLVMKACAHSNQPSFLTSDSPQDKECKDVLNKIKQELGGFFEYSLYDECTYNNGLLEGALNDYPCGGGPIMEEYLKIPIVKDAFHVRSEFFEVDNAGGDFDYTPTEPDLTGFYQQMNGKLKILVYNGDTDPSITSFATANWTSHLGFDEDESWRPWTSDHCKKMGGYVTRYQGMFDFLTIRGAGHMVPTYKPVATFAFMKAWIQGSEYPSYDANCTKPPTELFLEESKPFHQKSKGRLGASSIMRR